MAAYRRVYDSRHLPGTWSAPEPYARKSSMGYLYLLPVYEQRSCKRRLTVTNWLFSSRMMSPTTMLCHASSTSLPWRSTFDDLLFTFRSLRWRCCANENTQHQSQQSAFRIGADNDFKYVHRSTHWKFYTFSYFNNSCVSMLCGIYWICLNAPKILNINSFTFYKRLEMLSLEVVTTTTTAQTFAWLFFCLQFAITY